MVTISKVWPTNQILCEENAIPTVSVSESSVVLVHLPRILHAKPAGVRGNCLECLFVQCECQEKQQCEELAVLAETWTAFPIHSSPQLGGHLFIALIKMNIDSGRVFSKLEISRNSVALGTTMLNIQILTLLLPSTELVSTCQFVLHCVICLG